MSHTQSHMSRQSPTEQASAEDSLLMISVVVPIRNEEQFIADTLHELLRQDYPNDAFEIIVVDGCSTDGTIDKVKQIAESHDNVQLLENKKQWSSAARNIGIRASIGEVVIVVDGHCQFYDNQYLRNVNSAFQRTNADGLGRPQPLDVDGGSVVQKAISLARSSRLGHHPDSYIYSKTEQTVPAHSVAVAYRRFVFDRIGYFDEQFDACEDVELNQRFDDSGLHCVLAPSISLKYHPRASISGLFRQMTRYGRGRVRLSRKHASTLSLKSLAPAFFLLFLLVGSIPAIIWPSIQLPYLCVAGAYLAVVGCFSAAIADGFRTMLWLPLVFMAIHFGAGYGSLVEFFFGSSTPSEVDR